MESQVERSVLVWLDVYGTVSTMECENDGENRWGKEEGPYARLRALGAGEGDSRFGAAIRENSSLGSEKRVDSRGNGVLHRGL